MGQNYSKLGMHDIGFLADIPYADMLKLIWPRTDINTNIFFIYLLTETMAFSTVKLKYCIMFVNLAC